MSTRVPAGLILALVLLGACSPPSSGPASGPRSLPPDSAAMLAAAMVLVRPAFDFQDQALASDLYARGAEPVTSIRPQPQQAQRTASANGLYVIQVAAYYEWRLAEDAAEVARRRFPDLDVRIEEGTGVLRVSVGDWSSRSAAQRVLSEVRSHYPDAWVRIRASP